ncbi:MAG: hypothetical protein P9M14_04310 [Candidatus Alcyoniella australis]|nr:hypothetical protein [Candidatus Alcyoniella australis]
MARSRRSLQPTLRYAARLAALLFVLLHLVLPMLDTLAGWDRHETMLELVGQADVYRALFYALLPAAGLMLLPRIERAARFSRGWTIFAVICGLGSAAAYLAAPRLCRAGLEMQELPAWEWLAALYLGINVSAALWLHSGSRLDARETRLLLRGYGVADLLLPSGLYAAYAAARGRWIAALRPIGAGLVCALCLLPWLLDPLSVSVLPRVNPALEQLAPGAFFQVLVDPADGSLIAVDRQEQKIVRLDARSGDRIESESIAPSAVMALALDEHNGELLICEPPRAKTLVLDARSLKLVRSVDWDRRVGRLRMPTGCRTLLAHDPALLLVSCIDGTIRLDPQGRVVLASHGSGMFHDAVLDPQRGVLHLLHAVPGLLLTLDAATLEPLRSLALPPSGERMAFDRAANSLFISFPLRGQVLQIDLATYAVQRSIPAFPGVRALALDLERGLLICGGLSPLIELRGIADGALLARLVGPQWLRWIEVDPRRDAAYLTSGEHGLWRLDLARALDSGSGRYDPFYALLGSAGRLAQFALGWDQDPLQSVDWGNAEIYDPSVPESEQGL